MNYFSVLCLTSILSNAAMADQIVITPFATKNVDLTQSYHQQLLKQILKVMKSPGNPACADMKIKYYFPESIPTDYSALGKVSYNTERRRLVDFTVNNGGNVVFVANLGACGRYQNHPAVAGCAATGQAATVEISGDPTLDAMALLHEIGHSMGLAGSSPATEDRHTYPDPDTGLQKTDNAHLKDKKRVMHYQLAGGIGLSKADCAAYLSSNALFRRDSTPGAIILAEAEAEAEVAADAASSADPVSGLADLLGQNWLHEPPIQALKEAIEAAGGLGEIREIIAGDGSPLLWKNALIALGYFGVETDIGLVRYFLSRSLPIPEGRERVVTDAKEAASFALGLLTGRYASLEGAALAFEITTPQRVDSDEVSQLAGIDLTGLSEDEKALAEALVLEQTVIAQEIAFAVIGDEGKAALAGQNTAFASALEGETSGGRAAELTALGLDPAFGENLPWLEERIGEFQRGEVGVPYESLNLVAPN